MANAAQDVCCLQHRKLLIGAEVQNAAVCTEQAVSRHVDQLPF
jgi:hypothetical protein